MPPFCLAKLAKRFIEIFYRQCGKGAHFRYLACLAGCSAASSSVRSCMGWVRDFGHGRYRHTHQVTLLLTYAGVLIASAFYSRASKKKTLHRLLQ